MKKAIRNTQIHIIDVSRNAQKHESVVLENAQANTHIHTQLLYI